MAKICAEASAGGLDAVIVREPNLPHKQFFHMIESLKKVLIDTNTTIIINIGGGRWNLVLPYEFGIQVPEVVRPYNQIKMSTCLLGYSIHKTVKVATRDEVIPDYYLLGNIFATASHPNRDCAGTDIIAKAISKTKTPIIAIGGITKNNIREALEAGATGVAVTSEIVLSKSPYETVKKLIKEVDYAKSE